MKITHRMLILGTSGVLVWLLANARAVRESVGQGLILCTATVIPALFPFLVVSGLLTTLGFGKVLTPVLAGWMEWLFHLPGAAGAALILGLAGGYPIGAKVAADLYRSRQLTLEETQRLLTFCNNANPAFFLSVLGAGVFQSSVVGLTLWLIHVLSALLTGIFLGRCGIPERRNLPPPTLPPPTAFAGLWVRAVKNALENILAICAFVVIFYVLTRPLATLPGGWGIAAVGVTELFSLTAALPDNAWGFLLAAGCSGWGGLSVLCQTAAMLEHTGLSLRPCLWGKLLQGLLSFLLAGAVLVAGMVIG